MESDLNCISRETPFSLDEIILATIFRQTKPIVFVLLEVFPGTGNYGISVSRTDGAGSDGFWIGGHCNDSDWSSSFSLTLYGFSVGMRWFIIVSRVRCCSHFKQLCQRIVVVSEAVCFTPRVPLVFVQLLSPPDLLKPGPWMFSLRELLCCFFLWQLRSNCIPSY